MVNHITALTEAEAQLFMDPAIEAAYKAWASTAPGDATRKQFLMRIRFLLQSGKVK